MRYQQIKLTEEELMEINMSPGSLKRLSANIDALAGMEFEMVVPNAAEADEDSEPEADYDSDERARSIDDICEFFHDGDHNSRRTIEDLRRRMQNSYEEWADDQLREDWDNQGLDYLYQYVKNNVDDDTIIEALGLEPDEEGNPPTVGRAEWASYAERCMEGENDTYDEALEEFRDEWYNDSDKESDWLESEGIEMMSDVENSYNVTWPHWHYGNQNNDGVDVEYVADDFRQAIGRKVNWSRNYHGGRREPGAYVVEPDGSIDVDDSNDGGLEFVSPPLPLSELLSDLEKVKQWANRMGCYTNDSTGLHINVSVPGFDIANLDYVKLALLLGDEHILEVFGRMGNTYCKSAVEVVKKRVKQNPEATENLLNQMREHLGAMATKAIHSGATDKYTSINTKTGYIEFRSPGGDWLNRLSEGEEIQHTLLRFVVALDAAIKPDLYRQEYLKKLYKVLDVKGEKDPLSHFARFVAGEIPKQALKSFIRQAQLARKVKKLSTNNEKLPWKLWDVSTNEWATDSNGQGVYFDGAKDEALRQVKEYIQNRRNSGDTHNYDLRRNPVAVPLWWRVYKEGKNARNGAVIEVVASSEKEALEKAAKEWHMTSPEYMPTADAEPLRPYKEETKVPELHGRPSNPDGNYVIVNGATNEPAYRYMASDGGDALTVLRQWITANPGTQWNIKLDPDQSLGQPDQIAPPRGWAAATQQAQPTNQDGGRPNDPTGRYAIVARNDTAAYGRRGGPAPYYYFRFNMQNLEDQGHGRYVLQAWAARNNVNAADYMVVDTEEYADSGTAQDLPNLFPDMPAANPTGEFNGQWKVVDGLGREVYRFGGVGNSQADANRVAATWARTTGFDGNIEVYPVMD